MMAKYALLALALAVVWIVLLRPLRGIGGGTRERKAPSPRPAELAPCPDCGVYRLPGGRCDCTPRVEPPG